MTAATSTPVPLPLPRAVLHAQLGEPRLRRSLAAMIRRRVPEGEADDVLQAVLCDALASRSVPSAPGEIPRWLHGIARHKVADFHRRARRESPARRDGRDERAEPIAPAAPFDARVTLEGVLAEAGADARSKETFEWLLREHEGEQLAAIAEETRLPSPVVRQRVSRLRRALRARWLGALVAILALGGAARLARTGSRGVAPIVAEPVGAASAAALERVQGDWRLPHKGAHVRVSGALLVVDAPGLHAERAIVVLHADAHGFVAVLRSDDPRDAGERVTVRFEGRALAVEGALGKATLVR